MPISCRNKQKLHGAWNLPHKFHLYLILNVLFSQGRLAQSGEHSLTNPAIQGWISWKSANRCNVSFPHDNKKCNLDVLGFLPLLSNNCRQCHLLDKQKIFYSTELLEMEQSTIKLVLWCEQIMSYIFYYAILQLTLQSDDVWATDPETCVKSNTYGLTTCHRPSFGTYEYMRPPTQRANEIKENRIKNVLSGRVVWCIFEQG